MRRTYEATLLFPNLWLVKWYRPELAGNSDGDDFVESEIQGTFETEQDAINAAVARGSWA